MILGYVVCRSDRTLILSIFNSYSNDLCISLFFLYFFTRFFLNIIINFFFQTFFELSYSSLTRYFSLRYNKRIPQIHSAWWFTFHIFFVTMYFHLPGTLASPLFSENIRDNSSCFAVFSLFRGGKRWRSRRARLIHNRRKNSRKSCANNRRKTERVHRRSGIALPPRKRNPPGYTSARKKDLALVESSWPQFRNNSRYDVAPRAKSVEAICARVSRRSRCYDLDKVKITTELSLGVPSRLDTEHLTLFDVAHN